MFSSSTSCILTTIYRDRLALRLADKTQLIFKDKEKVRAGSALSNTPCYPSAQAHAVSMENVSFSLLALDVTVFPSQQHEDQQ